jgi:hypothetical protein
MGPDEHEMDLTGRPARRRRRAVMALLACVAIAIPGLALASSGGGGSPAAPAPQPSQYESPVFETAGEGDRDKRGRHGGRDCPKKDRDGGMRDASRQL